MTFANPHAWELLWLLPVIAAVLHLFYEYRCRVMARFVQKHLIDELANGFSLKLYRMKAICIMAAFVLMVAALSRPQWGFHLLPVKRHGLDIMVVIDVSKSMLTRDVSPSRLERTKLAVKDLVMKLNGSDHIGLIAFAGDAMVMCPLTYDYNGFLLSLDDLGVDSIPRAGTNISQAIEESINAYKGMADSDKAVVLVTDGEDEEGDAVAAARRAHDKGVRIFTVGVGTREGDLIQVTNADGQTEFLKDADGNVVKSHLNENLLQQIAYATGGAYVRSGGTQFGLDYLYDQQLSKLKKHDAEEKVTKLYDERFQWPLTLAFLFLLVEHLTSLRAKRSNLLKIGLPRSLWSLAMTILLIFVPTLSWASVAGEVNKANDLYNHGLFKDSLDLYQKALDQDNQSPVVQYDLGTALYKKGDYAGALKHLEQAAQDKNIKIKPKAEYNLGNALYKAGVQKENTNVDEAIKSLQQALGQYVESVKDDSKDPDAKFNEDFVKKEIERLKQKKEQQKKQQQQKQQQKQQQNQKQGQNQQSQQDKQDQQNQKDQQDKQEQQEQANKQNQQDQQKQQENQPPQSKDQQDKQPESKAQEQKKALDQAEDSQQELDRKAAQDLLEDYQENQEPKKLLSYMPKRINDRPVQKDW